MTLMLYLDFSCLEVVDVGKYSKLFIKEQVLINYERKDWHNWKFIELESKRSGAGEQGEALLLTDDEDLRMNKEIYKVQGLSVIVSDKISVNRSVPDTRHSKYKQTF